MQLYPFFIHFNTNITHGKQYILILFYSYILVGFDNILWCDTCNTPFIDENNKCSVCQKKGRKLNSDLRPVFAAERALLEFFNIHAFDKISVWTSSKSRQYFIDGKIFRLPSYEDYRDRSDEIREYIMSQSKKFEKLDEKYLSDYYNMYKSSYLHLKKLENDAHIFIKNVVKRFKNKFMIVSFSGGKDSTVVSDLVRKALGNDDIMHVFGDTGIEDENTYEYIKEFRLKYPNIPFFEAPPARDFFELVDILGPPSRVMRWCCTVIKAGPITNFLQSISEKLNVLTFYGIRHAESAKRKEYKAVTIGAKIGSQVTASPIIEWLEFDVWGYILSQQILFNKSYRLGFSRVGCWLCPMNSSWSVFLNSIHFSKQYNKWQDRLVKFAKDIEKPDPEVYVRDRKWAARQGGSNWKNMWLGFDIIPDDTHENIFKFRTNKNIDDSFIEFIKPLGKIDHKRSDFNKGIYIINKNKKAGHNLEIRATKGQNIVTVIALDKDDIEESHRFAKYQINKFQTCIQCTACAVVCPQTAIIVQPNQKLYSIDENKCINCNECITHFGSTGCLIAKSLSVYGDEREEKLQNGGKTEINIDSKPIKLNVIP